MAKVIDIDKFLNEKECEIKIGGKTFIVKDIPMEVRKLMQEDAVDSKEIVKQILGCTDKDLEGYGMAAMAAIINQVTENLFTPSSQKKA